MPVDGGRFRTEALGGAMVWQCAGCRVVFGDSTHFKCAHEELRTVTLAGASNVVVDEAEPRTSAEGVDASSTFFAIRCKSCDTMVGKFYRATPRSLDLMRDQFSFSQDAVTTYTLGHSELAVDDEDANGGNDAGAGGVAGQRSDAEKVAALEQQVADLEEQNTKTMNILLLYSERLERLEAASM